MSLILWDYDGVLVDSLEVEKEFFTVACQEAGIEEIRSFEDLSKLCEGNYYEECMKAGIDLRKVEEAIEILEKKIIESGCEINFFSGNGGNSYRNRPVVPIIYYNI
jgi:phosphoglycolate phosphatase